MRGTSGCTGFGPFRHPAAKAEFPKLANVKHVFVEAAARLNKRAEKSHQPTRGRDRCMRGFRALTRTEKFLLCFGSIWQRFALKRHLLHASLYRKQLAAQFMTCHEFVEHAQIRRLSDSRQGRRRTVSRSAS